jgi:hypothetical protein
MSREVCAVNIVRAPADVRAVVERWVQAEPKCNAKLEIRIVPTEGGLYLLARDDSGRVRERVVPDAQSAGVLVASWVAADSLSAPTPYEVRTPDPASATGPAIAPAATDPAIASGGPAIAPAATGPAIATGVAPEPMPPSAMLGTGGLLAPGEGAAPGASPAVVTATASLPPRQRWLSLSGLVAMSGTGGGGVRAEWDITSRRSLLFGLAASATHTGMMIYGASYEDTGKLETFDGKLIGYAGVSGERGHWHLRAALGAGLVFTTAMLETQATDRSASGVFPTGEASVTVGRDLGSNWALHMGPIVSLYVQEYQVETMGPGYYSSTMQRRDLEAMMSFALRYRL